MSNKTEASKRTAMSRRVVLRGIGGVTLGLPLFEGLMTEKAIAQANTSYGIFMRQGNGVQQADGNGEGHLITSREQERFWPTQTGALSSATMTGRAVDELLAHKDKLLMVKGVHHPDALNVGCSHARGGLVHLTASNAWVGSGNSAQAIHESIDNRIGRELNPGGRDSLCLYAKGPGDYNGGFVMSYRGRDDRRSAIQSPWQAFQTVTGMTTLNCDDSTEPTPMAPAVEDAVVRRRNSINDLLRAQLERVKKHPRMSSGDLRRLDQHLTSVRDLEVAMMNDPVSGCFPIDPAAIQSGSNGYNAGDERVPELGKLHLEVAALAVATGYTHSVAVQIGNGNDQTRYRIGNDLLPPFHWVSHRRGCDGTCSMESGWDLLHHQVDRLMGTVFLHLVNKLDGYLMPDGKTLLDHGFAAWTSDVSDGAHGLKHIPWVIAGSAGGYLKQGQFINVNGKAVSQMLNTLGTAAGLTGSGGGPLTDFGPSGVATGVISEMLA